MAETSQTEGEIKIIIKSINIGSRRPTIVLLKRYVKFNCFPTFFEAHLTDDIDEEKSFCKLFKKEARIILKKVNHGIWENIFDLPDNKLVALERRKEIVEQLQKKNVEIEEQAIKKFDAKKRAEVEREIARESKIREKFEIKNEKYLENELGVTPEETKKVKENEAREKKKKQRNFKAKFVDGGSDEEYNEILQQEKREKEEALKKEISRNQYIGPKIDKEEANALLQQAEGRKQIRPCGSIKVSFTKFDFKTPRRESQKEIQDQMTRQHKLFQETNKKNERGDEENFENRQFNKHFESAD